MFVAWRDLRFAKGRFALTGTVILLVALLVGLLSGLTEGLAQRNVSAIAGLPADRIAFRSPDAGQDLSFADSAVTERQWRLWSEAPGVESAEPLGIATTRASAGERGAGVSVLGVAPGSRLVPAGDAFGGGSAVLSRAAAEELGVSAGDPFTLAGRELRVADVRGDAFHNHTPVVWTGLDDWRAVAPPSGEATEPAGTVLALTTTAGADIAATDRRAGTTTVRTGDSLTAIGSYAAENGSLRLMRGFLFAISALVVGAFFTVWTVQRAGDVAVLKALGASTARLLADAVGQALVLLAGGTLLGTALAAAVGALLGSTVPFVLTPAILVGPAAVLIALGTLGAALAIRRITAVDPLTALGSVR
ncbi:ABC transporter permease [Streptomyces sedi]|uniref:ABC transporter permease n=1 Tax=Streptomyces sedi TaxID=555059 RepID=A0A5C4UZ24_9ACTN|nr:ABC transporter permease [Streptomyces sedi]TNM28466.1 ABC transporter permease [Streptomyces sedi]